MATILIVDKQVINDLPIALLKYYGHKLLEAIDGEQALEIIRVASPDLVIADILTLTADGYPFVLRLQMERFSVQPKILMMVVEHVAADAHVLAAACGAKLVVRSIKPEALIAAINLALSEPLSPLKKRQLDLNSVDTCLRIISTKLNQRVLELTQRNAQLDLLLSERAEGLDVARSALEQEVTKRLLAEQELTEANFHLYEKATRDPLTGLYNRGYLEESLRREISRARRNNQSLGVMMIDFDHFKHINDTFGHAAGDEALRAVAGYMSTFSRNEDILCRYGGEEFVLVMTAASVSTMKDRAAALRLGVQNLEIEWNDQVIGPITLSIGIALFPEHGTTGLSVLKAADNALYRAKEAGRNREEVVS